ncbi:LysR family transcriptional regulator [Microlunatus sp. GCM10028923]|uniref:LysR family transcriptional regulator n=1 Tax=Microlunatus sp. GCM10028923 TaxID=3273400 RepID=UPI00360E85D9
MSDLEVRELRYFVAVAEELHFGRAAERLGMAQPPLSRAIGRLERRLEVSLFRRTTREVSLTPAGESLLADARIALDAVAAAERRTRNLGRPTPSLRVAFKADFDAGLLPAILEAFEREPAARPVELIMGGRGDQVRALRTGTADVAILPTPFDENGLDWEPLLTEPRLLAVAATDPLAGRGELRLADLAGRVLPDGWPADRGDQPVTGTTPPPSTVPGLSGPLDLAQIFNLVALGRVVWFVPRSIVQRSPRPDIAYRVVADLPPTTLTVSWPRVTRDQAVAAFVRTAAEVAAAAHDPAAPTGLSRRGRA